MSFYCSVCSKPVLERCDAIQCDSCDLWVHQHKCTQLLWKQILKLTKPTNTVEGHCPICMKFPDSDVFNSDIEVTELPIQEVLNNISNSTAPDDVNENLAPLLTDLLNNVVTGLMTNDGEEYELELEIHSNACSYNSCEELNTILSEQ